MVLQSSLNPHRGLILFQGVFMVSARTWVVASPFASFPFPKVPGMLDLLSESRSRCPDHFVVGPDVVS